MSSFKQDLSTRRRLALLIGNSDYNNPKNTLNYAINNVDDLSYTLINIDFEVTKCENLDYDDMKKNIKEFANGINDGDLIVFYFCGHGCHVDNENYLIPIDDDGIESEKEVLDFGIHVGRTIDLLTERNRSYVTIVIIDCCKPYCLESISSCKYNVANAHEIPKYLFFTYAQRSASTRDYTTTYWCICSISLPI